MTKNRVPKFIRDNLTLICRLFVTSLRTEVNLTSEESSEKRRLISLIKDVEVLELCIRYDVAKCAFFRANDCTDV